MTNHAQMRPGEGARLFFVDDQAVLFHEPAQSLYRLNTTAAVVWCLLEDGRDTGDIDAALCSTFSISLDVAADYRQHARGLFESLGVLRGFERREPAAQESVAKAPLAIDFDESRLVIDRRYRLLSSRIRLRFTDPSHADAVEAVLRHLREVDPVVPTVTMDVVKREDGRIFLYRDGGAMHACDHDAQVVPLVKGLVWHSAIGQHAFFLDIHAGVVGDGRRSYVFPAAPGSGKSTLTAALVHAGFEYFSDEVALLHDGDLAAEPVPLALCVKHTGVETLATRFPEIRGIAEHLRGDGKRVRYLPPPARAVPQPGTRRTVGAIVFPRYVPGESTRLDAVSTIDALEALMRECLAVDSRLDARKVAALLDWLRKTPCWRLTLSDLDHAVELVRQMSGGEDEAPESSR